MFKGKKWVHKELKNLKEKKKRFGSFQNCPQLTQISSSRCGFRSLLQAAVPAGLSSHRSSPLEHMVQNLLPVTRINLLHEISPYICLSSFSDTCPDLLLFPHKQHFISGIDEHILHSITSPKGGILVAIWALIFTSTLVSPFRTLLLLSFTCALQLLGDVLSTPATPPPPPPPL